MSELRQAVWKRDLVHLALIRSMDQAQHFGTPASWSRFLRPEVRRISMQPIVSLMYGDRFEQPGLDRAWVTVSAALPPGWRLEGLWRASKGLQPQQRSNRWRAWAVGPRGEAVKSEGDGPNGALHALARDLPMVSKPAGIAAA
jgi:hypothetical protein